MALFGMLDRWPAGAFGRHIEAEANSAFAIV
jgi:hypothetical protein